jgi:hypothetical protein
MLGEVSTVTRRERDTSADHNFDHNRDECAQPENPETTRLPIEHEPARTGVPGFRLSPISTSEAQDDTILGFCFFRLAPALLSLLAMNDTA